MNQDHHNHSGSNGSNPIVSGSAHMGHMAADSGHGSAHAMAFHFGSMETILFKFWMPMSPAGIVLSCAIIIVMCFLMEFTRFVRTYRNIQHSTKTENRLRFEPTITKYAVYDALLHLIQITLSYSLMLIFMTFNVWLCGAVVIGEAASRLLFSVLFPYFETQVDGSC